jgi:hypothetical protein
MFEELDELARELAENDISRRQAIKWAGYSVAGATLSSLGFADTTEALAPGIGPGLSSLVQPHPPPGLNSSLYRRVGRLPLPITSRIGAGS